MINRQHMCCQWNHVKVDIGEQCTLSWTLVYVLKFDIISPLLPLVILEEIPLYMHMRGT